MKKCFFVVVGVLFTILVGAQNVVLDSISKEPIASVHISYGNQGIITNEDGYFELSKNEKKDSLLLSHVSYLPKYVNVLQLQANDTIYLKQVTINLDEVEIERINAKDTIIKGIHRIEDNYIDIPHNSFGFFRQSLEEDSSGIEMVEVEFIGYLENRTSKYRTKVTKARRTKNHSTIKFSTVGGVFSVIERGDVIKNKGLIFSLQKIDEYTFKYVGEINYNTYNVYKIEFYPKDNNDVKTFKKGFVYLDKKSLAFVEITYGIDEEKLAVLTRRGGMKINKKKPFFILKKIKNTIRYKKVLSEKWGLSSVEVNNVKEGRYKKLAKLYALNAKLIINHTKTKNPIPVKTNYNIEKDFSKAIRKIKRFEGWDNNYKISLSKRDLKVLNDIKSKE